MTEPADHFRLDPRIAFAAERTLLAWIRTGLAMMGFGFIVARFGWLMRELGETEGASPTTRGLSLASGTALIVLGVLTNLIGAIRHERAMTRLRAGGELDSSSRTATMLALALAIVGLAMAAYLFVAHV
jgi:putative membrane protein